MGYEPLLDFSGSRGVQNSTKDLARIEKGFLQIGENIDIDDEMMIHRTKGFQKILDGNYESLWSSGDICLFVQDGCLKRLWPDNSVTVLLTNIDPVAEMTYLHANGRVYFSNNMIVGQIVNGTPYPFPEPNIPLKKRMVGGQLLEWFNSRLYAAQDDKIFHSDAAAPTMMDHQRNFIQMGGYITMMKAVADGMFVSAGKRVVFLGGLSPKEFKWLQVSDCPAFRGSAVKIEGEDVGKGFTGTTVAWTSAEGVFMGFPGGAVKNLTKGNYVLDEEEVEKGTAIYRDDLGCGQYLFLYTLKHGKGGAKVEIRLPAPTIHALG